MSVTVESAHREYSALKEGAALQIRPQGGVLELIDADRVDFLHRMTTNDIAILRPGQSAVTILTSPTARTVFAFTVLLDEDRLLLLPAPGETVALDRHLRGQIFFMDKVTVSDRSADFQRLRVMGPCAADVMAKLGVDPAMADGAWRAIDDIVVVKQMAFDVPGFEVVMPTDRLSATVDDLRAAGATVLESQTAYAARRIELGRPAAGSELTGEYNPLEAGMAWVCAENKGCYTGQEIIARQITYDKVTKTLIGVLADGPLAVGTEVQVDGRTVGKVTSTASHPVMAAHLALAILKRPWNEPETRVEVAGTSGLVVELPFPNAV